MITIDDNYKSETSMIMLYGVLTCICDEVYTAIMWCHKLNQTTIQQTDGKTGESNTMHMFIINLH